MGQRISRPGIFLKFATLKASEAFIRRGPISEFQPSDNLNLINRERSLFPAEVSRVEMALHEADV